MTISRGQLRKLVAKVSDSVPDPYEQVLAVLPQEDRLNVDETGHPEDGQQHRTWCFRASFYAVFKMSPSRGSQVLVEVLGEEVNRVLRCDYFSDSKCMKDFDVAVQFSLAHFIPDVKFLADHPNKKKNRRHGKRLLELLRKLFQSIIQDEDRQLLNVFREIVQDTFLPVRWASRLAALAARCWPGRRWSA